MPPTGLVPVEANVEGGRRPPSLNFLEIGARLRLPLDAVDQSRWQTGREGALLKPMCGGDPVRLTAVDRMSFLLDAKGDDEVRFCMTPLVAATEAPPPLDPPSLPAGTLLDNMGQSHFDVFSINGYKDRFPSTQMNALYDRVQMPIMVGEWHFGALDAGLPGGCLRRVASQRERGKAYRVYAEGALAHPACVGVHWFTLYDESPMGRFDGENWNTGFLDVCHRPYEALAEAARRTHERMYAVAAGDRRPYRTRVDYRRTNIL